MFHACEAHLGVRLNRIYQYAAKSMKSIRNLVLLVITFTATTSSPQSSGLPQLKSQQRLTVGVTKAISYAKQLNGKELYVWGFLGELGDGLEPRLVLAASRDVAQNAALSDDVILVELSNPKQLGDHRKINSLHILGQYVGVKGRFECKDSKHYFVELSLKGADLLPTEALRVIDALSPE